MDIRSRPIASATEARTAPATAPGDDRSRIVTDQAFTRYPFFR